MTRNGTLALLVVGLGLALVGLWLMSELPTLSAPPPLPVGATRTGPGSLGDLLASLEIVPLDGTPAPPFALERLEGGRLELADVAGRPALLYFWATW